MVEDGDNKNQDEPTGTPNPEPTPTPDRGSQVHSDIDRAEEANKVKAELLTREEKLQDRRDKETAIRMVGGQTVAGQEDKGEKKEETNHEYHERIKKEMAEGKTDFTKTDGN